MMVWKPACGGQMRRSRGYVLVPVALVIALVAVSAYLITRESAVNVELAAGEADTTMLRYVAEAGFQHAKWQAGLAGCSNYPDLPDTPFGNGYTYNATIAPDSGSPIVINATATSATGATGSVSRDQVKVYDPAFNAVSLRPGAEGKDTFIYDKQPTWNYGAYKEFWVTQRSGFNGRGLLQFDLSVIPANALVLSAILELHQNIPAAGGGPVAVHRVTSDWTEGTGVGGGAGAGTSWNEREPGVPWASPGGDFDPALSTSVTVPAGVVGWFQWQIRSLVNGWVRGTYNNYGLMLVPEDSSSDTYFDSSDTADPALHPRLTVTFVCECGADCLTQEKIILSTSTDATLGGLDFTDVDLAEYDPGTNTATLFFDGGLTTLDKDIDASHVLANGHILLSTAAGSSLGGLSFDRDDLIDYDPVTGTAAMVLNGDAVFSSTNENIDAVYVTDDGHFILSTTGSATLGGLSFGSADLVEYDPVADTATLFFDGALFSGGNEDIDAVHILENGHIILSDRNDGAVLGGLTYNDDDLVEYDPVAGTASLYFQGVAQFSSSNENVISVHIGGGSGELGCGGTYRDEFNNNAFDNNDGTRLWSGDWIEIDSSSAGPNTGKAQIKAGELRLSGAPVSGEDPSLARQADLSGYAAATLTFDFRTGSGVEAGEDSAVVEISNDGGASWTVLEDFVNEGPNASGNRSYDITSFIAVNTQIRFRIDNNYGGLKETFYVDNVEVTASCNAPPACDADFIPDTKTGEYSPEDFGASDIWGLAFLPEGTVFNGGTAPANGAWLHTDLSNKMFYMSDTAGNLITSRATPNGAPIDVALIRSGAWVDHLAVTDASDQAVYLVDPAGVVQGSFSTGSYTEHPMGITFIGTTSTAPWSGHLAISSDKDGSGSSNAAISIVDQSGVLQDTIDVSGFAVEPWGAAHLPDTDKLLVVDKGGTAFLVGFDGTLHGQYDVSTLFGAGAPQGVAINPLNCEHAITDHDTLKVMSLTQSGGGGDCNGTFRDEFNARSYANNDGTLSWATDWLEINESNGPTAGDEQVLNDQSDYQLRVRDNDGGGEGVQREADLSGAATANLSLDYRRSGLDNGGDYATVEINANGGTGPWVELDRFQGSATDPGYQSTSYDISAYISANTRIRFLTSSNMGGTDTVYFDNVEIQCAP